MKALYLDDMYLKEFTGIVQSVSEKKYVILDQTAFYPKSGGVDYDTGKLIRRSDNKEFNVVYTTKIKGKISHEIEPSGLKVGDEITGILDWNRRYELMRYHSAAHVLSGIFWKEGQVKITGNNLVVGKGRIDFNLEEFDRDKIRNYVKKANQIIQKDLPINTYYISREELKKDPTLMKLEMGLPKKIKNVRIVEIENFDKQPDGGCHIHHLSEIGTIKIKKIKNKGKGNRRLYFKLVKN